MSSPASSGAPASRYSADLLATVLVPWDEGGACDEGLFRATVRDLARDLTPELYLFGTAGEGHAVSETQFRALTLAFADELRRAGGEPMVGIISLSLPTIIERIAWARAQGVRRFQLSLPAWGPLNDREVDRFFAETCGRFPDVEILHYNLMRTGRLLTGAEYARLAPRHPNLIAIKMGGANLPALTDVAQAAGACGVRCFFTEFAYLALRETVPCGLLCALSACAPNLAHRLGAATTPEQRQALEPVFRELHAAAKEAVEGEAHIDGAYDKLYLKLNVPAFPLRLLPPYAAPSEERFNRFAARVRPVLAPFLVS